jgi:DNA-binding CsgD family transcriptional regulator
MTNGDSNYAAVELSARQLEIVNRILEGRTPKSIAFELGLSIYTIREHLSTIYEKFEVCGRDELMACFISRDHLPGLPPAAPLPPV